MSLFAYYLESPPPFRALRLGATNDGQEIALGYDQLQYHVHLVGLSGKGKSRAIEYLLRQLLIDRQGFTLIDPHGDIYDALLAWLAREGPGFLEGRRIHLFDPAHPTWRFGYNPMRVATEIPPELREAVIMDRLDALMEAVAQVMGGEEPDAMPLYQRTFSSVLYALATKGFTIYETMKALPATAEAFRRYITQDLPDPVASEVWEEMHAWSRREFTELMSSLYSRMHRLMRHPFIRQTLGQSERVLDVGRVMDEGEVVLVNLAAKPGLSRQNAQLLARLLISDYAQTALGRAAGTSRPHFLVIDECYRFLTDDVEDILDQTRKFGLHLVLAHQRLSQLKRRGESVYEGVMEGAQIKLVFGTTYQSGLALADQLFAPEYNLERPKHALDKPVQVGVELTKLRGQSRSQAAIESWTHSTASMVGAVSALSESAGESYDAGGNVIGSSMGSSSGSAVTDQSMEGESLAGGTVETFGESVHEAFRPIYRTMVSAVHSLEEERHLQALRVSQQEVQRVMVQFADKSTVQGVTAHFERPLVAEEAVQELTARLCDLSDFVTPAAEVAAELDARWQQLEEAVERFLVPDVEEVPKSIRASLGAAPPRRS